jgi:hypothetical protein
MERIFKNPTFLLSIWNKHISNSLKTSVYPDSFEYLQNVKLSKEKFKEILDVKEFPSKDIQEENNGQEFVEWISRKIFAEIFRNSFEKIAEEFPRKALELLYNIAD